MVAANKKGISNELLHIALVITLLRSGTDNRFYRQSPVISTNFFNDVSVSNERMGPSWAYSRTSFHHHNFYHDPPIHEVKALDSTDYWSTGNPAGFSDNDLDSEWGDDDLSDLDLNIINQLRSLTISRFNSLPRLGKDEPTFQDITAYLLSESTSPTNAASPPHAGQDLIESFQSNVASSPDAGQDLIESFQSNVASSPDAGQDVIEPFQLNAASPPDAGQDVIESFQLNAASPSDAGQNVIESFQLNAASPPDAGLDVIESFQWNAASSPDAGQDTTLELLEDDHLNEVGGAAGIDHVSDLSPSVAGPSTGDVGDWNTDDVGGWNGEDDFINYPEILFEFEAECSTLEYYKKFNDITDIELNNVIAPQDLHVFDDDDTDIKPHTSTASPSFSTGFGSRSENEDSSLLSESQIKQETSKDPVPSSSRSSFTQDDVDEGVEDTQDVLSAMLDDILESDSGVFDFFGASPEHLDNDIGQDEASANSPDSSLTTPPRRFSLSTNLNEDSGEEEIEADESNFLADMIQTAPIHAGARPTSHAAQPRGFQVHSRMPGLLRGSSMEQRWQDLANLLSLQSSDPSGAAAAAAAGIHQPIPHHFAPHPYHHPHHHHHHPHTPNPLHHHHHHHSMHPPHFGSAVPPTTPYSTDTARSVLLQNATLPPPELNATGPYGNVGMGASANLGSAVASSMHLTNSSEPMLDPSSHYKMMDPSHDMLYYQNSTAEMGNQTSASAADGFNLSSILNDDELQLMDMAMNEGMYSMRVMDNGVGSSNLTTVGSHPAGAPVPPSGVSHNGGAAAVSTACSVLGGATGGPTTEDRMEASSDSAVSSMGSERVPPMTDPPMSDNEWVDADSHPHGGGPHDLSPYSMDYSRGKLGGYGEYYGKDGSRGGGVGGPQKKHHMFGKRFQQEQGSSGSHPYPLASHLSYPPTHHHASGGSQGGAGMDLDKYGCSTDFGRYNGQRQGTSGPLDPTLTNHTYALPPTHPENPLLKVAKPQQQKEKQHKKDPLTRDEKKARAMNIPITTEDIINLPMDEFNERLSKYDLSETQLSLIRDIRRRGKNKVAAQNCRKRKLDQIIQLADEVHRIREKKQALLREQDGLMGRRSDLKERYSMLYRTVFQALRDSEGNPYSPFEYNLHHAADGSVVLLPRNATQPSTSTTASSSSNENGMSHSNCNHGGTRRDKPKDENKKE